MSEEEWESAITNLAIAATVPAAGNDSTNTSSNTSSRGGGSAPSGAGPPEILKRSPALAVPVPVPVPVAAVPVAAMALVVNKSVSSAELELADVTSMDDGLISALVNPRERLNALTYEKRILEFVSSPDNILDIPPIYNSFHRLLLYRIAQRFNLDHCHSDAIYPYGERGISIVRTANTAIPRALLVEVSKRDDLLSQVSPPAAGYDVGPNTQSSVTDKAASSATAPAPGKIKVMKRNTSGSNTDKKSSTDKSTVDISDKEKAYAEARARIFGDEAPTSDSPTSSSSTPAVAVQNSTPKDAPVVAISSGKTSSSSNESRSPVGSYIPADTSRAPISNQQTYDRRDGSSRHVNPTSWSGERAVLRDRGAERNDPDFNRRPLVAPTLPYQGYGGAMPTAQYGYGYAYGGGAMPPQGGYPGWQPPNAYAMGYPPNAGGYQNPPRGYSSQPPQPPPPPPNNARGYAPQSGRSYKDEFPQLG